jgi:RNA polymerase sigma-70 factor (ECF subfamily)
VVGTVAGAEPTPSRVAVNKDLLAAVRARLTDEERQLADLRGQGLSWDEIVAKVGGKAQARRVQFSRALQRVIQELKLEESRRD